jgi:hypothetical protein
MSSDNYADNGSCWRSVKSDDGYDTADESDGTEAGDAILKPSASVNTSAETYSRDTVSGILTPTLKNGQCVASFLG